VVVLFPTSMMLTLVYFGEHNEFDGLLGVAYVLIAFRFWDRYEAGNPWRGFARFARQA
jgi:hypothetical protein